MAKQPRDSTPVEVAYSAWLRAAREAAGSGAAVVREMQTHLERHGLLGDLPFKWQPEAKYSIERKDRHWHSTAFRQWEKGRKSSPVPGVPDEDVLRDALVAVVSGLVDRVPAASAGWATFRSVFDALLAERELSRQDSGVSARARGLAEREHRDRNILAADPGAAKNLDPLALGLGSWVLDGDLPNYIPRTPDRLLAEQLTGGAGVTVVVGPPKSGKSRSVLQVLQDRVPAAWVWWVNPAPGVLPELVTRTERAGTGDQAPEVIVLDDAHLHGVNPTDGLTHARLTKLARTARVVVIVHEADLAAWQRQARDRSPDPDRRMAGIGATVELVDLLTAHRIDYPPVLDDTELATAAAEYDRADHHLDGLDLTRMAEVFASVDHFKTEADLALGEGDICGALIDAAIDATIVYPTGATLEELEELCKLHYHRHRPNRPWRTTKFDDTVEWATTGYTGSPHAILTRTSGTDFYRLFDALVPHLRSNDRPLDHLHHLELDPDAYFAIGSWAYGVQRIDTARTWWEKSAAHDHLDAMVNLGYLAFQDYHTDRSDTARIWWEKAVAHDDPRAMHYLGSTAWYEGDTDTARIWWTRAASSGYYHAMFLLGDLADEAGDTDTARTWWEKSAAHDDLNAMLRLGHLAYDDGDRATARTWWTRAAEASRLDEFVAEVLDDEEDGDTDAARIWQEKDAARTWQEKAALHHYFWVMHNLGILAYDDGDTDTARTWWTRAAASDHCDAMFELGVLADADGDTDTARTWWEKAGARFHPDAMSALGALAYDDGDTDTARTWWEETASYDRPDAMFLLGNLADEAGDTDTARTWWEKAAALGSQAAQDALDLLDNGEKGTGAGE